MPLTHAPTNHFFLCPWCFSHLAGFIWPLCPPRDFREKGRLWLWLQPKRGYFRQPPSKYKAWQRQTNTKPGLTWRNETLVELFVCLFVYLFIYLLPLDSPTSSVILHSEQTLLTPIFYSIQSSTAASGTISIPTVQSLLCRNLPILFLPPFGMLFSLSLWNVI